MTPAAYSSRSVRVVLPASTCATIPRFSVPRATRHTLRTGEKALVDGYEGRSHFRSLVRPRSLVPCPTAPAGASYFLWNGPSACGPDTLERTLGVAAEQCHRGDRDERGGQDQEDAGLDALERPVAVGGLVGQEPAEVGQRLRARRWGSEGPPGRLVAGRREVVDRDAGEHVSAGVLVDRLAVREQDAR